MALSEEDRKRLDEKAKLARAEFASNWERWTAGDVALWWHRWCTMDGTNHDRLGRILMDETGARSRLMQPLSPEIADQIKQDTGHGD